jgi:hypothetical protein
LFVPCTPALLLALQGARSQRDIATAKDTLIAEVRTTIDSLVETGDQQDPEIWNRARQYQDRLFDQRCRTERVLGRIYEQHRDQDEDVMQNDRRRTPPTDRHPLDIASEPHTAQ